MINPSIYFPIARTWQALEEFLVFCCLVCKIEKVFLVDVKRYCFIDKEK